MGEGRELVDYYDDLFDDGDCDYWDQDTFLGRLTPAVDYTTWTTKAGAPVPVALMRDSHMENIVRFLTKRRDALNPSIGGRTLEITNRWLEVFEKEIAARKASGFWYGLKRRP
jgi:hypothetical protein